LANESIVGQKLRGLSIDRHNRIYVADHTHGRILVWERGRPDPQWSLNVSLAEFTDLFVGMNGEVFFEHRNEPGRIEKWSIERNESLFVAKFDGNCYGLFIDLNNSLYCSQSDEQKVSKISLNSDGANASIIVVAGNGSAGSTAHQLNEPWGIFVDREFTLFVADGSNHRIQRFRPGEANGTTVFGRGTLSEPQFDLPTDVILDGQGYFYIADNQNHRVIRVKDGEWKCIAACQNRSGSNDNELHFSYALQLDSSGNLYVADEFNHRIQRFEFVRDQSRQ
jgi:hypothetical protein